MQTLLDAAQIDQLISALADEIVAESAFFSTQAPVALVGIVSRGELLAQRLAARIVEKRGRGESLDVGALDISFYRDDLSSRRAITIPRGTDLNFGLDDRPVIVVDDVLETGRSVRAALDALVDFGRPRLIRLAVLVDRGRRELPIAADYVGLHIPHPTADQKIVVRLMPTDSEDGVFLS
jgi:pyrimidine operon attenuation protein/uracil phosphoribosyltransferase